ncbi:MAG: hypothetical protein QXH56_03615 [Thermoprotei archaeon]
MQITWHVFRPLSITERHVSHAPTTHNTISDIVHVLEWVIPFGAQMIGVVCEEGVATLEVIRFVASYLYTSRIVYLSEHLDMINIVNDLSVEKGGRVSSIRCRLDSLPIRSSSISKLILVALRQRLPMTLADALRISSDGVIIAVDSNQYVDSLSHQLIGLTGNAVGYVDTKWVLVALNKQI